MQLYAKERRGHDARKRGFGLASWSRGPVFLKRTLQAQRAEDWCSHKEKLQTQMPYEDTHRLAASVSDSFSGAVRAAYYEFPQRVRRTRRKKLQDRTRIMLPRPGVPARRHCRPTEPTTVHLEGDIVDPNVQRGYRRVGTVGLCHVSAQVDLILAFSANERRRPEAINHGSGSASCSRSLVFPDGDDNRLKFKHGF